MHKQLASLISSSCRAAALITTASVASARDASTTSAMVSALPVASVRG